MWFDGFCFGRIVAVMVGGGCFWVLWLLSLRGELSRRRRLRGDTGPRVEFGWGPKCRIIGLENDSVCNIVGRMLKNVVGMGKTTLPMIENT